MHSRQDPNQPHSSRNCTSSSAAHLTDLAQAAERPEQATQGLHQGKDSSTEGEQQFSTGHQTFKAAGYMGLDKMTQSPPLETNLSQAELNVPLTRGGTSQAGTSLALALEPSCPVGTSFAPGSNQASLKETAVAPGEKASFPAMMALSQGLGLPAGQCGGCKDMDEDEEEQWLTQPSQAADETEALNGVSGSRPTSQLAQSASQSTSSLLNDNEHIVHTQATRQARGRQILHPAALHPFCHYGQTNEQEASTQQKRQRVSQPPSGVGDLHTGSQPSKQTGVLSVSNGDLGGERQDEQRQVVSDKSSLEGRHDQATEGEERAAGGVRGGSERRVPRRQSLLMRLIDDFLFITPSLTAAEALVNKLLKGKLLHLRTPS